MVGQAFLPVMLSVVATSKLPDFDIRLLDKGECTDYDLNATSATPNAAKGVAEQARVSAIDEFRSSLNRANLSSYVRMIAQALHWDRGRLARRGSQRKHHDGRRIFFEILALCGAWCGRDARGPSEELPCLAAIELNLHLQLRFRIIDPLEVSTSNQRLIGTVSTQPQSWPLPLPAAV